jgi:AcrR family transcriptional regulator
MVNSTTVPGARRAAGKKGPRGRKSTPPPSRVRLQLDERRAQLLEAGRALFNERAYDDIAIDDIAAAAGVSKGLLYHYFPSKRRFFVEAVRAAAVHMLAVTETEEREGVLPAERLRVGLDAYLDYVDQNARAYAALFRSGLGVDPEIWTIVESTRQAIADRIVLGLGVQNAPPLVRVALRGWIGTVESASLDWLEHRDVPRDKLRELLAAALEASFMTVASLGGVPIEPQTKPVTRP